MAIWEFKSLASLNQFALLNTMHKCVRAEAETSLCSVKAAVVLSREEEGTELALMALKVTLQSSQVGCSGRRGSLHHTGNGHVCLAYVHPSLLHSAPYLFCTPLCTAGPPLPEEEPGHHR